MQSRTAINLLLILSALVILFHLSVLVGLVPYEKVWGGRLESESDMLVFEITSIVFNLFLVFVLLIRGQRIKAYLKPRTTTIILWFFLVLFLLNTVGNVLAKTTFEKSFSVLTLLFSILIWMSLRDANKSV